MRHSNPDKRSVKRLAIMEFKAEMKASDAYAELLKKNERLASLRNHKRELEKLMELQLAQLDGYSDQLVSMGRYDLMDRISSVEKRLEQLAEKEKQALEELTAHQEEVNALTQKYNSLKEKKTSEISRQKLESDEYHHEESYQESLWSEHGY